MLGAGILTALGTQTLSDTQNTYYTRIVTSLGGVYTATAVNLRTAVNSLANTTGSVYIPSLITITDTLYVGEGCTLYSDGNGGLTQANGNNKTLLRNYAGKDNINILNLRLEGNGVNQPEWWHLAAWTMFAYGIYFTGSDNVKIDGCFINDSACGGILIYQGDNITIQNNRIWNSGKLYKDSGTGFTQWQANHIYTYNCSNILIEDNICFYSYACGIVVEGELSAPFRWRNYNWIVDGNTVTDTGYGYYFEDTRDGICSDNIAYECDDIQVYGQAAGIRVAPACARILFENIQMYSCDYGIQNGGSNITFSGCESYRSTNVGTGDFYNSGTFNRFMDCYSEEAADSAFYNDQGGLNVSFDNCEAKGPGFAGFCIASQIKRNGYTSITNCKVYDSTSYAVLCYANNATVKNCIIRNCAYGIYFDACKNATISLNDISNTGQRPIRLFTVDRGLVQGNYINKVTTSGSHGLYLSACKNISVWLNIYQGTGSDYPQYGTFEAGACRHNWILLNKGIGIGTLTTLAAGSNSRVNASSTTSGPPDFDDWNWDI
jgi:parallel beta-helix repeat protein